MSGMSKTEIEVRQAGKLEIHIRSLSGIQLKVTAPVHQLFKVRAGLQLPGARAGLGVAAEVDRDQRKDGFSRTCTGARCREETGTACSEKESARQAVRGLTRGK